MNWAIIATIVLTWVDSLPLVLRVLKRITANHEDAELIAKRNCFMSQNIKISFDNVIIIIYIFLKHCWQRLFPYWSQHKRNNWYLFIFWTNSGNPKPILVLRVFNMNMWRENVLKVMNRTTVLAHGCKNEKLTQVLSCLSILLVCLAASKDFF